MSLAKTTKTKKKKKGGWGGGGGIIFCSVIHIGVRMIGRQTDRQIDRKKERKKERKKHEMPATGKAQATCELRAPQPKQFSVLPHPTLKPGQPCVSHYTQCLHSDLL